MLTVAVVLKALAEIAACILLGQGLLHLLAGAGRERNPVYLGLRVATRPLWRAVRALTPDGIGDPQVTWLTVVAVVLVWVGATAWKIQLVLELRGAV
jgi:hypothetical protein